MTIGFGGNADRGDSFSSSRPVVGRVDGPATDAVGAAHLDDDDEHVRDADARDGEERARGAVRRDRGDRAIGRARGTTREGTRGTTRDRA